MLNMTPLEQKKLQIFNKVLPLEFGLSRITQTMLDKSIIDASQLIRQAFLQMTFLDYSSLKQGTDYKQIKEGFFIFDNTKLPIKASFYRPLTKQGDPRFWIYNFKRINGARVGDLILFTVTKQPDKEAMLLAINLSSELLSKEALETIAKNDEQISTSLHNVDNAISELLPLIKEINEKGFIANYKGPGKQHYKDVGQTLEHELDLKDNSNKRADFKGLIELKAKRVKAKSKDTLFSMVPDYSISNIKSSNEMIRTYGYPSNKYADFIDLFVTVSTRINNQGLYLIINENKKQVEQWYLDNITGKKELTCVWLFNDLEKRLFEKHNTTLWVLANEKKLNDTIYFHYYEAELSRRPSLSSFITLIESGDIVFDWRGRVKEDRTGYKDKGHAWRMNPKSRKILFGDIKKISL